MNFDYDLLKDKLTNELYNQYSMQLEGLKLKNQQNIMSDFKYIKSDITNIINENNIIEVTTELSVSFYDYVQENGKVVRGNKNKKIIIQYEIKYASSKIVQDKCPACGADINNVSSGNCPYCKCKIIKVPSKWVMSKKRSLNQR